MHVFRPCISQKERFLLWDSFNPLTCIYYVFLSVVYPIVAVSWNRNTYFLISWERPETRCIPILITKQCAKFHKQTKKEKIIKNFYPTARTPPGHVFALVHACAKQQGDVSLRLFMFSRRTKHQDFRIFVSETSSTYQNAHLRIIWPVCLVFIGCQAYSFAPQTIARFSG